MGRLGSNQHFILCCCTKQMLKAVNERFCFLFFKSCVKLCLLCCVGIFYFCGHWPLHSESKTRQSGFLSIVFRLAYLIRLIMSTDQQFCFIRFVWRTTDCFHLSEKVSHSQEPQSWFVLKINQFSRTRFYKKHSDVRGFMAHHCNLLWEFIIIPAKLLNSYWCISLLLGPNFTIICLFCLFV